MTIDELRAEIKFQKNDCIKLLKHAGYEPPENVIEMSDIREILGATIAFQFVLSLIEKGE